MNAEFPVSTADRLEHELERLILEGEYQPGARINENALAARFDVSRGAVREACRLLQRSGPGQHRPQPGLVRLRAVGGGDRQPVRRPRLPRPARRAARGGDRHAHSAAGHARPDRQHGRGLARVKRRPLHRPQHRVPRDALRHHRQRAACHARCADGQAVADLSPARPRVRRRAHGFQCRASLDPGRHRARRLRSGRRRSRETHREWPRSLHPRDVGDRPARSEGKRDRQDRAGEGRRRTQ